MKKLTHDDLKKLARLSHIRLDGSEMDELLADMQAVISYAERVVEAAQDVQDSSYKNVNVVREDVVVSTNPQPLLAQAPEGAHDFFVVPAIIEK